MSAWHCQHKRLAHQALGGVTRFQQRRADDAQIDTAGAQGFARLLAPGGLLLVSTPDRHTYTDLTGVENPHHVRELYRPEFEAMVAARFPVRRLYGQKLLFTSLVWALDDTVSPPEVASLDGQAIRPGITNAPR